MTAVIVAHDGAAWLPHVADALLEQTRPVQRVVAVDTGSRDRSGAVLAAKFGQAAVFGMDRGTGYGAAVARALQHRAANVPIPGSSAMSAQDRTEWLWLLHDDCEPAPDALEQLLRGVAETTGAAVLGPKLRDWANREVILEAGITLDTAARRLTGIEPREVDQGQHDGDRDAMAVSSAGMLVRRDVWDQVGGFDTAMGLFMEDIDFCWRVHAAGYRVRVITDAVAYHMQAATRHRRTVSVGRRGPMLDRRNGLLTLLGNLPFRQMLTSAAGNAVISLLRITFFLLAKRLIAALDEAAALVAALGHPLRLMRMRRRRSRGRRSAYSRIRADLPPGRSVRRLVEFAASTMLKSAQIDTAGAHHASADPTDDDSLLVDNIGLARRLLTSPVVLTFVLLTAIALAAGRSLLGSGPLGGGALVPAWGGASDLWHSYLQGFHPSGIGSTSAEPPYLAVLAVLATLLGGKPWLAIEVVLLGCVPLGAMSAMLATRRVTKLAPVRVWAAAAYGLLPVAMGVVAAGRFGTAIVFVLLPVITLAAGQLIVAPKQQARRAAWATGLLVAIGAMFVPLLSLAALLGCVLAALIWRNTKRGRLVNLAIAGLTAPVLLLPWTLTLVAHPAELLLEAGLQRPGTATAGVPARSLLLISPGGPGLPPFWVTAGLLLAALAALLAGKRRRLIMAGWGVAIAGLLLAIVVSRLTVIPADGGTPVAVWAGFPLALAAVGLLLAAVTGAEALARMLAVGRGWRALIGGRGALAALLALTACSAPLIAAAWWIATGVNGPVRPVTTQLVPELVAMADGQSRQVRTLVLRMTDGHVSYLLLRGPSPSLADVALTSPPAATSALNAAVAALIAPGGGGAASQSQLLADFDIGYVLMQTPVNQQLGGLLDNVAGLRPYSTTSRYDLWQLDTPPARVTVVEPSGTVVPVSSGPVGVSGVQVPAAGGTLMLAEPIGGWSATLNGKSLTQVRSPAGGWAQAFRLPAGGGTLSVSHSDFGHDLALVLQALALLAVVALALPGIRMAEPEGQHAGAGSGRAQAAGAGRDLAAGDPGLDESEEAVDARAPRELAASVAAGAGRTRRRAGRDLASPAKAGRGRTARGKGGRGRPGRGKAGGKPAVVAAAGGRAASATRTAWPAAPGAERGARLPDAWPYAAGDDRHDQRPEEIEELESGPWTGRDAADQQASGRTTALPYPAGDELDARRSPQLDGLPARPADLAGADRAGRSGVWSRPADDDRPAGRLGDQFFAAAPGSDLDHAAGGRYDAWPYPAGDEPDIPRPSPRRDPADERQADHRGGGRSGAWPYSAQDLGPRRPDDLTGSGARDRADPERGAGSRSGAWPYPAGDEPDELDSGRAWAGRAGEDRHTGERPAVRPDWEARRDAGGGQHALPPGRPPTGRGSSGEWAHGAARDELGADRRANAPAKSPSGWLPPPDAAGDADPLAERSGRSGPLTGSWLPAVDQGSRPGDRRPAGDEGEPPELSATVRHTGPQRAVRDSGGPDADRSQWQDDERPDRSAGSRPRRRDRDRQERRGGDWLAKRGIGRQDRRDAEDLGQQDDQRPDRRGDSSARRGVDRVDQRVADGAGRRAAERPARPDDQRSGRFGRDRGERLDAERPDGRGRRAASWDGGRPDGLSDGRDRWEDERAAGRGSDRRGGDHAARWDGERPDPRDSGELARWDSERTAGRGAGGPDHWDRERSDRRDSGELARWDSERTAGRGAGGPDRWDRERSDRRDSGELARWDSTGPDARIADDGLAGRGRHGASGRSAGAGQVSDRGGADPAISWPGGGGDALEPLPPPADSGQMARGRSSWRPSGGRPDPSGRDSGGYDSGGYDSGRYDSGQADGRWGDPQDTGSGWQSGRRSSEQEQSRRFSRARGRGESGRDADAGRDRYGVGTAGEQRWPAPEPEPEYEGEGW